MKKYNVKKITDVKAMWLSQFDLSPVFCSGNFQRDSSDFRERIRIILSRIAAMGYNTVIVQTRPNADSMYPSQFYTASAYVVGEYGKSFEYDPFEIIVDEAHAAGLAVHAWINPLRCMKTDMLPLVDENFPIRRWYDDPELNGRYLIALDGLYYLDPAYPEVRRLIIDGARELCLRYNIDGLHMDDYFYPTETESFDALSYGEYMAGGGKDDLPAFRRRNLDLLVSGIYSAVKSVAPDIPFGISPAGNIKNVYGKQFADVYRWCSESGFIDYICPQVYFGLEHETCDFAGVCRIWQDIIKTGGIDLWIGMTLGKAKSKTDKYAGIGKNEWAEHRDILLRCLEFTKNLAKCTGVSYFCYQYFADPLTDTDVEDTKEERDNFLPLLKEISWQ
ncbi:MAG: family 10 glycosylhydrolase [Clostridia bacterium]|nr:family 10 glycosylhydrolase [Clostridia bacterium]